MSVELRSEATSARVCSVRSCSAPLDAVTARRMERTFQAPVLSAYGMTETTHQAASQTLRGPVKPGSVGLGTGVDLRVTDRDGRMCPADAVGALLRLEHVHRQRHAELAAVDDFLAGEVRLVGGAAEGGIGGFPRGGRQPARPNRLRLWPGEGDAAKTFQLISRPRIQQGIVFRRPPRGQRHVNLHRDMISRPGAQSLAQIAQVARGGQ